MKLIIDLPEEVVTAIQNGADYRYDIHTAIAQGKPLKEPEHTWFDGCYPCTNCQEFECDGCEYNHNDADRGAE